MGLFSSGLYENRGASKNTHGAGTAAYAQTLAKNAISGAKKKRHSNAGPGEEKLGVAARQDFQNNPNNPSFGQPTASSLNPYAGLRRSTMSSRVGVGETYAASARSQAVKDLEFSKEGYGAGLVKSMADLQATRLAEGGGYSSANITGRGGENAKALPYATRRANAVNKKAGGTGGYRGTPGVMNQSKKPFGFGGSGTSRIRDGMSSKLMGEGQTLQRPMSGREQVGRMLSGHNYDRQHHPTYGKDSMLANMEDVAMTPGGNKQMERRKAGEHALWSRQGYLGGIHRYTYGSVAARDETGAAKDAASAGRWRDHVAEGTMPRGGYGAKPNMELIRGKANQGWAKRLKQSSGGESTASSRDSTKEFIQSAETRVGTMPRIGGQYAKNSIAGLGDMRAMKDRVDMATMFRRKSKGGSVRRVDRSNIREGGYSRGR